MIKIRCCFWVYIIKKLLRRELSAVYFKKGSLTEIPISQLPRILEGSIKAQIEGFDDRY